MSKKLLVNLLLGLGLVASAGCNERRTRVIEVGPASGPATEFEVTIENLSGESGVASGYSRAAWAVHDGEVSLFLPGQRDMDEGLEPLAEDGDPARLVASLAARPGVSASGNTEGGTPPGASTSFRVQADPLSPRLSLAMMFGQSNDQFLASEAGGIPLFDAGGEALGPQTLSIPVWDAGTEADETPRAGIYQGPRQSGPDQGPSEGVVRAFHHATRSLPPAIQVARVRVEAQGNGFAVSVENVAGREGGFVTPLAPVFWAVHDASWSLFADGQAAPANGLETLAEDGSPAQLVGAAQISPGVAAAGAATVTVERPADPAGPAFADERFVFSVQPTAAAPRLSFACMVVESNDVFVALDPAGIELLDEAGRLRSAEVINAELEARVALWDAGTEANETPGAGSSQPLRQGGPNQGALDADPTVRRYADVGNDLAGPGAGGLTALEVTGLAPQNGLARFRVTVRNRGGAPGFAGILTPVAWALHDASAALHLPGARASAGLAALAEDGNAGALAAELSATPGVGLSGVAAVANGAGAPGPITAGGSYTFEISVDPSTPRLSLATMVVPSNDTFLAFGPEGLALLDAGGQPRSDAAIAQDLAGLRAWDAGSELNQIGAAGPDQAPRQAGPDTGAAEGTGLVRRVENVPGLSLPPAQRLIRLTIRPVR